MPAIIRLADESDAEQIQAIYAPVVRDTAVSFELEIPSVSEIGSRVQKTLERFPWLVCEHLGRVQGYAYAGPHRTRAAYQWSVDVSVYVREGARRKGVGRGVYKSLLDLLVLQGFHRAFAGITLPNPASVGLHEAMGFEPLGVYRAVGYKLGAWHDVGWWQTSLRDQNGPANLPSSLSDLIGSPEWDTAMGSGLPMLRL